MVRPMIVWGILSDLESAVEQTVDGLLGFDGDFDLELWSDRWQRASSSAESKRKPLWRQVLSKLKK
jgi:hypothetical protein